MENFKVGVRDCILLKANFNVDRYAMLRKQMGFKYSEYDSIDKLDDFHNLCKSLVNNL
jgi:hypothetical protein